LTPPARRAAEEGLGRVGKRGVLPLWGRDTGELAREFIAAGFEAILVCVTRDGFVFCDVLPSEPATAAA
jgi:diphthamide synthase (EF-2-diphthine--ammonia ligase)